MKVTVNIDETAVEPEVAIRTATLTDEVQMLVSYLEREQQYVLALDNEKTVFLRPADIVLVRVEQGLTQIYAQGKTFTSRQRLYEVAQQLGSRFVQISKGSIVNLSAIKSVEPTIGTTLKVKLAGGLEDYISRTYLKDVKKRLGL